MWPVAPWVATLPWDMTQSAALHSQLSGVIAGFLFVSMTVVIGRFPSETGTGIRPSSSERDGPFEPAPPETANNEMAALYFMSVSFVSLLIASFQFGVTAGFSDPLTAQLAGSGAAIVLAIGAVGTIASVAWLLHSHQAFLSIALRIQSLALLVYAVASLHLSTTLSDSLQLASSGEVSGIHPLALAGLVPMLATVVAAYASRRNAEVRNWLQRLADILPDRARGYQASSGAVVVGVTLITFYFLGVTNNYGSIQAPAHVAAAVFVVLFHTIAISLLATMPPIVETSDERPS
jgi:hypothetical protein